MASLTDTEQAALDFEGQRWKYAGAKAQAIRDTFGHSHAQHAQVVQALIDRPEALAYAPQLVLRLRRLREGRARGRRLGSTALR